MYTSMFVFPVYRICITFYTFVYPCIPIKNLFNKKNTFYAGNRKNFNKQYHAASKTLHCAQICLSQQNSPDHRKIWHEVKCQFDTWADAQQRIHKFFLDLKYHKFGNKTGKLLACLSRCQHIPAHISDYSDGCYIFHRLISKQEISGARWVYIRVLQTVSFHRRSDPSLPVNSRCGTIPPSCFQAHIKLIPKKGKDPMEPGSYRLIFLLNLESKIL